MILLAFALGLFAGMYLPPLIIRILTLGEHRDQQARRLSVDEIIEQALGPRVPRPRTGRHEATMDDQQVR